MSGVHFKTAAFNGCVDPLARQPREELGCHRFVTELPNRPGIGRNRMER